MCVILDTYETTKYTDGPNGGMKMATKEIKVEWCENWIRSIFAKHQSKIIIVYK